MIPVLTIKQPWARLIKDHKKNVETRSWATRYKGPLGIHASSRVDVEACAKFGYDPRVMERGMIICTAILIGCVQLPSNLIKIDAYGDFSPNNYAWVLIDVKPLSYPFVANDKKGLWRYNVIGAQKCAKTFEDKKNECKTNR